jgi:aldose 1-epimerase
MEFELQTNGGAHALHGGEIGFDKVLWQTGSWSTVGAASLVLEHVSPDGDQGYPGELRIEAKFSLDAANVLNVEYRATTSSKTIVNITNHTYWNLAGEGSPRGTADHELQISADAFLPIDPTTLPTGEVRSVTGTSFDFRKQRPIFQGIRKASDEQIAIGRGYDHNWIVAPEVVDEIHHMATLVDPISQRSLEVWSNQPGLQFYSGNFLDGTVSGKAGQFYRMGDGLALEPQLFPDSPNRGHFPNAFLEPGDVYLNRMEFRFGLVDAPPG